MPTDLRRAAGLLACLLAVAPIAARAETEPRLPPLIPNTTAAVAGRALPCVVKLYGASIGRAGGFGSGVLVSRDGLILTIDSILLDSRNLRAVLHDGRRFAATLVRRDEGRELALLRIAAHDLPCLVPAASAELLPGDPVIAAGNCFKVAEGEEPASLLRGIVVARTALELRRRTQPLDYAGDLILIDAITSNPGMAGGPLLDLRARLIGLIGPVAIADATNTRVNYAIPGEALTAFLAAGDAPAPRRSTSHPARALPPAALGIHLFTLGYVKVAAYVDRVAPGSPADRAGLQPDDLIVALNDRRIATVEDFNAVQADLRPGDAVRLTVKRGGQVLTLSLTAPEAAP
ncbi:MAG: trypsin-like peptidase domain-containing protein [Phycisphaerae bacterium]